jgi:hypothetical protein
MDENTPRRHYLRFGIRDLLWAMVVVSVLAGWWWDPLGRRDEVVLARKERDLRRFQLQRLIAELNEADPNWYTKLRAETQGYYLQRWPGPSVYRGALERLRLSDMSDEPKTLAAALLQVDKAYQAKKEADGWRAADEWLYEHLAHKTAEQVVAEWGENP